MPSASCVLAAAGYTYVTVNHRRSIIDLNSGGNTQKIERGIYKNQIWPMRGNRNESLLAFIEPACLLGSGNKYGP